MSSVTPPPNEDEASLFSLATEYLEAASILEATPPSRINVSLVTYYLLGHAGELLLKSFLVKRGVSLDELKLKLGHNLDKLSHRATELGLPASVSLQHLRDLSKSYTPKTTEYRQHKASTYPPQGLLLAELRSLENAIFDQLTQVIRNG